MSMAQNEALALAAVDSKASLVPKVTTGFSDGWPLSASLLAASECGIAQCGASAERAEVDRCVPYLFVGDFATISR